MLHRQRTAEENQDVGHGRMEVGQSHPALLSSASQWGRMRSNDVRKIYIFAIFCVIVVR